MNTPPVRKTLVLVGSPNVGKSVLFHHLTGLYAMVSNYPGTTVEVSRGKGRIGRCEVEVIDTPGMYSLLPLTEEEKVARNILFEEKAKVVLHVVDAKNLERMLATTLQLIEAEFPVMLVLNMMDEVEKTGQKIHVAKLEGILRIPVVATSAVTGQGIEALKERVEAYVA